MIVNALKKVLEDRRGNRGLFVRTLFKEVIQDYVLNFVYNHKKYKKLIFTGGTCLRKIYGLPRLSEDLDFDATETVLASEMGIDVVDYFSRDLQYKDVEIKISTNGQTIFLKFPKLLSELGMVVDKSDATMLFVRCDLAKVSSKYLSTQIHALSTPDFSFFVSAYDLPTLFAHKIAAFLQRDFFKGGEQSVAFKGRDVFDLVWFFERVKKTNSAFNPNWDRLGEMLGSQDKSEIADQIVSKIQSVQVSDVIADLEPFVESETTLRGFGDNFKSIVVTGAGDLKN